MHQTAEVIILITFFYTFSLENAFYKWLNCLNMQSALLLGMIVFLAQP